MSEHLVGLKIAKVVGFRANKKAKCIGWISKEIVMVDEEFYRLWQKEVWSNFIKSGQPVEREI